MPDESPLLVFIESNSQLLLGVHDDGPVPGHGLSDGFAGYQEEADGGFFGGDQDLISGALVDSQILRAQEALSLEIKIIGPDDFMFVGIMSN